MENAEKIRCRSCQALNDSDRKTCEKCGAILVPENAIVIDDGSTVFMAESSNGLLEHQSGFFRKLGDKWMVAELTLLRGVELKKRKDGCVETKPSVKPILIYNKGGERGYLSLKDRAVDLNGETITLEGTPFYKPLETLMSYETALSFLHGRNEDLAETYSLLRERIKKFINFEWDLRLYDLVTCIVIAIYFFDVFRAFPIIFAYGPHETGKSRLVKCIVYAGRKGLLYVSPTPAPIYRAIDAIRPTLGVDEFTKMYEELMQLARAIYKKGLMVPRMEKSRGQRFFLTLFETYTPLVVASTKELDEVTMSRAILVNMKRGKDPSKRDPEAWDFEDIRDRLYICRLTYAHIIDQTKNELDNVNLDLIGREYEVWRPVLCVAKNVGSDVYERMLQLAKDLTAEKQEGLYENEKDVLTALHELFGPQLTLDKTPEELTFYPKDVSEKLFEIKKEEFGYTGKYKDLPDERQASQLDAQELREAKRNFNKVYGPRKIGWILKRLGLKYKHTKQGNQYRLTFKEFEDYAKRVGMKLDV